VLAVLAAAVAAAVVPVGAADIVISRQAGGVIADIADATRTIRLAAVPTDLRVRSNKMVFDYERGELAYLGDVRVAQNGVQLTSDDLRIAFEPRRSGALRTVRASGNVKVVHDERTATGQLAVYDPGAATITLTGDARLGTHGSSLEGESVVVYLDEGRATVDGGGVVPVAAPGGREPVSPAIAPTGRVRAVIDPGSLDIEELGD